MYISLYFTSVKIKIADKKYCGIIKIYNTKTSIIALVPLAELLSGETKILNE